MFSVGETLAELGGGGDPTRRKCFRYRGYTGSVIEGNCSVINPPKQEASYYTQHI